MRRVRTDGERDAATVEVVFAAATGALLAAAGFAVTISPVLAHAAHGTAREGWYTAAVIVAAGLFCGRVAVTLRRFERENRLWRVDLWADRESSEPAGRAPDAGADPLPDGTGTGLPAGGQPSQPGRTSPDS